jgi:ATPase subunit of ABC transporter with duplicated ATPase domains
VLAGETQPAGGTVTRSGEVGYLPQDPRTGNLDVLARDRILSARGLDEIVRRMRDTEGEMASTVQETHERAMNRYGRLEAEFTASGGYAAESEAATIAASLSLPDRVLGQPLATLSGGQRRRVELARILFSGTGSAEWTLLLDEPTNHLDADSILWLRGFLQNHRGGLVVISHDVGLLDQCVNRVFHLDANRSESTSTTWGWKPYLQQRETDERRRKRERANARSRRPSCSRRPTACAPRPRRPRRRRHGAPGREAARRARRRAPARQGRQAALPRSPLPCGRTPLTATGLSKSYGSLEIFTDVDLAIDRGSRVVVLGLNGAGKTTLLRLLGGVEEPDTGEVRPGHGLRLGYYAQEHETLDRDRTVLENMRSAAPDTGEVELRRTLGQLPVLRATTWTSPAGCSPGGEKTRLALATLVVVERERAAARRADEQPRPGQPAGGARRAHVVRGSRRARDARRGRRRCAEPGARRAAARRRRGSVDGRLPRSRLARVGRHITFA